MDLETFLLIAFFAVVSGFIGFWIADKKNREPVEGFFLGAFLGPIGWIIEGLLDSGATSPTRRISVKPGQRKCPFCAELIQAEAIVCRYCQRDLPAYITPGPDPATELFAKWKHSK